MPTMVLVHGASQGAWCWEKVKPLLSAAGWNAVTPDLPGHGEDKTPLAMVTMDRYVDCVCNALALAGGKSVLVGHSMGGAVVSMVAEAMPESVQCLIYVSGFLPRPGQTVAELLDTDPDSQLPDSFDLSEDQTVITPKAQAMELVVYNGCSAEDARAAVSKLCPQAVAPMFTPLEVTRERFGAITRHAVVCTQDNALSPAFQRDMYATAHCSSITELPSGHAPFFSMPDKLVETLVQLAKT